jgi:hypothetical protein
MSTPSARTQPNLGRRNFRGERAYLESMRRKAIISAAIASVLIEAIVVGRRRGSFIGPDTVVRCRAGHLFTTIWIPGASVKSLRLGWWRFQRCPMGPHWSLVTPVVASELSDHQKDLASQNRDIRLP